MRDRRGAGTAPITMETRTTIRTALAGTAVAIGRMGHGGARAPIPTPTLPHRIPTEPTMVQGITTGGRSRRATIGLSPMSIWDYGAQSRYGGKPGSGLPLLFFSRQITILCPRSTPVIEIKTNL